MVVPHPVRLFHITAISNLDGIFRTGALLAKNHGVQYANIAHQGAQGARSARSVPNPPGGVIHDYVPFYYAPRSPMLYAINGGRVAGCGLRQGDIAHLEFTVDSVLADGSPFVIFDRNATLPYAAAYVALADLDKIAWQIFFESPLVGGFSQYFHDRPSPPHHADRREKRMAEFIVRSRVELHRCVRIGVIDAVSQSRVDQLMQRIGLQLRVDVQRDWYF